MKKKLIGFILCGLILATVSGCSDTPTQVSQINNGSSLESADVTSDKDDKDNSDESLTRRISCLKQQIQQAQRVNRKYRQKRKKNLLHRLPHKLTNRTRMIQK